MTLSSVNLTQFLEAESKSDSATFTLLNGAAATQIRELLEKRGVLIFCNRAFDAVQQTAFARTLSYDLIAYDLIGEAALA